MTYLAKWDGGSTYLSRDEQMEQYLKNGASIYQEENGVQTLIATPSQGFLVDRPTFPTSETSSLPKESHNAVVEQHLLGSED